MSNRKTKNGTEKKNKREISIQLYVDIFTQK